MKIIRVCMLSNLYPYSLQLTAYCLLLTAYCLQLTAYSLLLTAYSLQLTAYSLLPPLSIKFIQYPGQPDAGF
jgi:hypothetical protein